MNNEIYTNAADEGAGIRFCFFLGPLPEPAILGNLIYGNQARVNGGGIQAYRAHPVLFDCTLHGNGAPGLGGGVFITESTTGPAFLTDCIISGSPTGGGLACSGTGNLENDHCDVWGNIGGDYHNCSPGPGTISADPMFCDDAVGAEPFEIYEISSCVGAGTNGTDIGAHGVGCFSIPNVVFYDNFSDQNDDGWVQEIVGEGEIEVLLGRYSLSADEETGFARTTVEDFDVSNLDLHLDLFPAGGTGWIDLVFRRQDATTYYQIALDGTIGRLEKHTPDVVDPRLMAFSCPLVDGLRYEFKVRADAGLIRAWYRWEDTGYLSLFTCVDPAYIPHGTIGIGVDSYSERAHFDNILVVDTGTTDAPIDTGPTAVRILLGSASPNPFGAQTLIPVRVAEQTPVRLSIYDAGGRLVRLLFDGPIDEGTHTVPWDGTNERGNRLSSGIYLCRLHTQSELQSRRILLLR